MITLFKDIHKWSLDTFKHATPQHHLLKLIEESKEAINEPGDISEYADCFIALIAAATRDGFDYHEIVNAIDDKMEVNRERTWIKQSDGTFQHK